MISNITPSDAHRNPTRHVGYGLSGIFFDAEGCAARTLPKPDGSNICSRDAAVYFSGAGFAALMDENARRSAATSTCAARLLIIPRQDLEQDLDHVLPAEWARMGVMARTS